MLWFVERTELMAEVFPDESRGTKYCDSEIGVGLTTTWTTFVDSSLCNSRQEQIGFVVWCDIL